MLITTNNFCFRGTFKWGDLLASVTNDQKAFIKANQSQIGIHDVTNIQFTSVCTFSSFICTHLGLYNVLILTLFEHITRTITL